MWDQLDATISDFIVNQFFLNTVWSRLLATYSTQCTQLASRLSNIKTVTTGQITIRSENAVWPPEDGHKDARNMLRKNWLTIKSLTVASSWSHIYLQTTFNFLSYNYYKFKVKWKIIYITYQNTDLKKLQNNTLIWVLKNLHFKHNSLLLDPLLS